MNSVILPEAVQPRFLKRKVTVSPAFVSTFDLAPLMDSPAFGTMVTLLPLAERLRVMTITSPGRSAVGGGNVNVIGPAVQSASITQRLGRELIP